jgi:AraC-like DNA-binding protein
VSYITRTPSPRLSEVVERLWRVDDPTPAASGDAICPDGCAEIVIHLGDPMLAQPRHLLVGQMERAVTVRSTGRVTMVGARLTPAGLYRLLPLRQERLVDAIVPLDAVWNAWTRRTSEQIAAVSEPAGQLATFERALEDLLPDIGRQRDRSVSFAVRCMRARGGPLAVDRIAAAAGISRRQLERRFREQVGLSPNLFGRIIRFQRAFAAVGHEPGAALAARLGFVDQAHLVREVRRFSGQTPTLLADADGLTAFFANAPGVMS